MKNEFVKILSIVPITHDVLQIVTTKPADADFWPGQATEVFLDKKGWESEGRPFTFTSLPTADHLEFMIKTYPSRKGVTGELLGLKAGDSLVVNDVFGDIEYKGEGTFIAGGAGVTPFIAILRDLQARGAIGQNRLIFANKTRGDIILHEELREMLGDQLVNILSGEKTTDYAYGQVSEKFIKEHCCSLDKYFYVCAPPPMMEAVEKYLADLKVPKERVVMEMF